VKIQQKITAQALILNLTELINMKRIILLPFIFIVLLTLNFSALAKDDWLKVQTANFELVGNASEKEMRRVATKLEQFRFVFKNLFSKLNFTSPIPTRVVIFKDEKSFKFFKTTEWVAGYFQPGEDVNYIVLSTEGEKADTYRVIFHEFTHFLVDNSLGRSVIPSWFNEGIAEYYEQFQIENDQKVMLGGLNNEHLLLLSQGNLIPFEDFFTVDYYSLQRQTKQSAGLFYAQSWAFVHFLQHGIRRSQMSAFVNLLLDGKPPKFSFEKAFQAGYATVESEFRKYITQRQFQVLYVEFKEKLVFDNEMKISIINPADAKAIQGDLLYHIQRLADAEKFLNEALALDANSSFTNTSLGLVKMRQRKFTEARQYLEKAIKADARNFLAHYSYAFVLSREEMTETGFSSGFSAARAEQMRESLQRAIALNPSFAESYNLLTFINIVRNEQILESIEIIKRALEIAPGNQWYQMRLAELYMLSKNFGESRNILQRLVASASEDGLKLYAENSLSRLNSLESQLASLNDRQKREIDGITEKPLSEEEIARRNALAMNESLNCALRIPKADEKRFLGYIAKVECQSNEIFFTVKTDDKTMRLRSNSFDVLHLISFDEEFVNTEFGCGTLKKEAFAVITYRPAENAKNKTQGELIAIEFMPKNFTLTQ
jgi:tetratricopeptide (TPR) repeat protein